MNIAKIKLSKIIKKEELFYGLILLALITVFDYHCIIKGIFHIACPGCGLTRAFQALLSFDVMASLSYYILAIPMILYFVGIFIARIVDQVKGTQFAKEWENPVLSRTQMMILVIIMLSNWLLNNLRGL